MDRILNSIALVCVALAVSIVSFGLHSQAQTPLQPRLFAARDSVLDAARNDLQQQRVAAEEYALAAHPKVKAKPKPPAPKHVAAPLAVVATPAPVRVAVTPSVSKPVATPKPAPAPVPVSTNSIDNLIKSVFAAQGSGAVAWALHVADCESGDNPNAVSPGGTYMGLFQFDRPTWNSTPYASGNPFDAATNAKAAAWLYQRRGPSPWGCSYM